MIKTSLPPDAVFVMIPTPGYLPFAALKRRSVPSFNSGSGSNSWRGLLLRDDRRAGSDSVFLSSSLLEVSSSSLSLFSKFRACSMILNLESLTLSLVVSQSFCIQ